MYLVTDGSGVERYLLGGKCEESCPESHYISEKRACEPCAPNCVTCTSATHCHHCASSFCLKDGACVKLANTGDQLPAFYTLLLFHQRMCLLPHPLKHSLNICYITLVLIHKRIVNKPGNNSRQKINKKTIN